MKTTLKIAILLYNIIGLVCFVVIVTTACSQTQVSVSVSCMMAYDEGGAPAIFDSHECTQWILIPRNRTIDCQHASLQGLREYQEDRVTCDLQLTIPLTGIFGPKEVNVGLVAVFDGHGGKEASEIASQCFIDYFRLHSVFIMYKKMMMLNNEEIPGHQNHQDDYEMGSEQQNLSLEGNDVVLPTLDDRLLHLDLLRDALVRTIHDIDSKFSQEAYQNKLHSGSTAVVAIMVDGKILVANVGDSKAFMCSAETQSGDAMLHLLAKELTEDHHPDREDERARIEAAGGSVIVWGVPRVNGILSVSRAIGDVYLKRYGLISVPELFGWKSLSTADKYLIVASDGIFESLAPKDVCDLIFSSCSSSSSLVECIVAAAYEGGSMDNLSAIVVPLSPADNF